MEWHAAGKEELLSRLDVDPAHGLGRQEAKERLSKFGPNELAVAEGPSPFGLFLRQFKDVLIIILVIATILSAAVGELFDAGLILLIVLFSAGLGFLQEYRAEKAIEALRKILSPVVTVFRDGVEGEIPSRELVPGDILVVEAGNRVPADARIIASESLMADESSLTGESVPVEKISDKLPPDTPLSELRNILLAGTIVTYGRGRGVVVTTGMNTELGEIAREVGKESKVKTPLELRTQEIGKWLGIIAFSICFLVAVLGIGREAMSGRLDLHFALKIFMFAVALAVAAVPEALAAIVTGTLAIGMRDMAKRNALVRRMPAVETLGAVTVVCSDKTGTITKGEMTAKKLYSGGVTVQVPGVGYELGTGVTYGPEMEKMSQLITAGALCNNSELYQEEDRWRIRGMPTEGALLVLAEKAGLRAADVRLRHERVREVPFSSERKRMTTVHRMEDGTLAAFMKGAPEVVLDRCSREQKGGQRVELGEKGRESLIGVAESMAEEGLRVLALASMEVDESTDDIETGMDFLGLVGIIDPPRVEAVEAVRVCRDIGITPVMITGDHKLTAMAVAREVGICREGDLAVTDTELSAMSDEDLEDKVERISVYARISPMNKLRIVRAWKARGQVVAMTGDGVNDAPALKHADIGVAMGITGTEVSKEAADMVLADDNFATILSAIERGRWIYDNIKKYLTYLLKSNVVEVVVLGGVVILKGPEYLPMLPAAILYVNLVTDGLPALALGVSPPEPDLMKRPPRDPEESVFSGEVKTFIGMALVIYSPLLLWVFLRQQDLLTARTELFFLFVLMELVIALNFTSLRYSIFRCPPHKWLLAAVGVSVAVTLLLFLWPEVRDSMGLALPRFQDLAEALAIGLGVTAGIEAVKAFFVRRIA